MNRNRTWRLFIAVVAAAGLAGCQTQPDLRAMESGKHSSEIDGEPWSSLSTFAGTVPCAACPGIEMVLQLKPDGTFFLRSTYLEAEGDESHTLNDIGRWALTRNDEMLIVRAGSGQTRRFTVVDADRLQMLDTLGRPIESELPNDLVRIQESDILTGPVRLKGMYRYLADAALFKSCQTRMRYPVVFEEAHVDLERAYLGANEEPGSPMMASFVGRIERRPRMEGEGEREFVVVVDFTGVYPGEGCYEQELPLERTVWRLVELDGRPISVADPTRIPHVVLVPDDRRATGSGGCNRFTGSYEISGDSLRFYQLASTKMACPVGMDLEDAFMEALDATTTFDHFGGTLELRSENRLTARLRGFAEIED